MFAPPVAKAKAKTPATSTNGLTHQRSAMMARGPGHSQRDSALMLQHTIGNQAVLRFLAAERAASGIANAPVGRDEQGAARSSQPARGTKTGASWDFSAIPIFPPDRANQTEPPPPLRAPRLPGVLQAKLAIGSVNDPLEHEADRVADEVMRIPAPEVGPALTSAPPQVSRKCAACEEGEKVQRKEARSAGGSLSQVPASVHEVLRSPGQPLGEATRSFFEPRFGFDFSPIRIHTDPQAAASARAVAARAYTVGSNIVFNAGEYRPSTREGRTLLAHELAHVRQNAVGCCLDASLRRAPQLSTPVASVQLGETDLRQVARRLNVDPDELLLANPQIKDPFALLPGQAIYLPVGQEPATPTQSPISALPPQSAPLPAPPQRPQEGNRPAPEVESCIPPHRESSGKRCKFFVYDSEEPTWVGNVWIPAIYTDAAFRPGAYVIPSGKTIEDMLFTLLSTYAEKDCDCTEAIQFWSHGSPANGMSITGDGDLEADDFNISGLAEFGDGPISMPGYRAWYDSLTLKQRRLVLLRRTICDEDSEVYYRSCQAFQKTTGQEFAKASASFWRCSVAGHTKLIGISQPGKKVLAPCQEPYWSETEGIEEEGKKGKTKNDFAHIKPR